VQGDSGKEKIFTGQQSATWTVPALAAGSCLLVHNISNSDIVLQESGVTLLGTGVILAGTSVSLSWVLGNRVKIIGQGTSPAAQYLFGANAIRVVEELPADPDPLTLYVVL